MLIDKIKKIVIESGNRIVDDKMIELYVLYYTSILFNRYKFKKSIKNLNSIVNLYTIVFNKSGSGKSFFLKLIEQLILPDREDYIEGFRTLYNSMLTLEKDAEKVEVLEANKRFLPSNHIMSLDGTKEGLFSRAEVIAYSKYGSLNMYSEEFLDLISSSQELLNKLKEYYDGLATAKIIKGNIDTKYMSMDIYNITTNLLATGSIDNISKDDLKLLIKMAKTGIYRRSIIMYIDMQTKKTSYNPDIELYEYIEKYLKELNEHHKNKFIEERFSGDNFINYQDSWERVYPIDIKATLYIDKIDTMLIDRANSDKLNDFKQYDMGSLNNIVNIAYLYAFLDNTSVKKEHLERAYQLFIDTRETTFDVFKERYAYDVIFDILTKTDKKLTHIELMEYDKMNIIPIQKNRFKDEIQLVKEKCIYHSLLLNEYSGYVTRFSITELPNTNLDELVISLSTTENHPQPQKEVAFEAVEFPFSMIEQLVVSEKVQSFTTSHFKESAKTTPYGHRKKENHILGQNVIAFDFDDGNLSIEDAILLFEPYTYCLYTTKSHQTEKSNYQDRFRVIMPTLKKFYTNSEQHKEMYKNVEKFLGIKNNDTATRNISRLWFTNPEAERVFTNEGELIDVLPHIPDTDRYEKFININFVNLSKEIEKDEINLRYKGMLGWFLTSTRKGNLKNNLYKLYEFMVDIGYSKDTQILKLREACTLLGCPLRFAEELIRNKRLKDDV